MVRKLKECEPLLIDKDIYIEIYPYSVEKSTFAFFHEMICH